MALTLSGTNGVVGAGFTVDASGVSVTAGVGTFSSLQGSGANLTALPAANLTGTVAVGRFPAGTILQVVNTFVQASSSYGTSANSHYTLTPLNTTITPIGTNSKFLISAQVSGEGTIHDNQLFIRLIRNTASGFPGSDNIAICTGDNGSNNSAPENTSAYHGYATSNSDSTISTTHITNHVDSPSVAAGGNLQYKVQIYLQSSMTWYLNRCVTLYDATYGDYLPSFVTVMEIAQ